MKTLIRILSTVMVLWVGFTLQGPPAIAKPGMRLATPNLALRFQGGKPVEVWIEVQLVVVKTGKKVPRGALLYLSSDYDAIVFPSEPRLDGGGFARLKLVIPPPGAADRRRLQGRIAVWVLIDEEDADDTIEGGMVFSYTMGGG